MRRLFSLHERAEQAARKGIDLVPLTDVEASGIMGGEFEWLPPWPTTEKLCATVIRLRNGSAIDILPLIGVCDDCGKRTLNQLRPAPYDQDVKGLDRLVRQCNDCYESRCEDI